MAQCHVGKNHSKQDPNKLCWHLQFHARFSHLGEGQWVVAEAFNTVPGLEQWSASRTLSTDGLHRVVEGWIAWILSKNACNHVLFPNTNLDRFQVHSQGCSGDKPRNKNDSDDYCWVYTSSVLLSFLQLFFHHSVLNPSSKMHSLLNLCFRTQRHSCLDANRTAAYVLLRLAGCIGRLQEATHHQAHDFRGECRLRRLQQLAVDAIYYDEP